MIRWRVPSLRPGGVHEAASLVRLQIEAGDRLLWLLLNVLLVVLILVHLFRPIAASDKHAAPLCR